jgi:hypothetical protein
MRLAFAATRRVGLVAAVSIFAVLVDPAAAQTTSQQPATRSTASEKAKSPDAAKAPASKPSAPALRVNAFVEAGYQSFVATETFEATLGKTGGPIFGGGASLTHRSGLLFQVDISRFTADGERAFVHNGQVFKLDIPLRVETMPLEFTFGYKFFTRPPSPPKPPKPPAAAPAKHDSLSTPLSVNQAKPQAPPAKPTPTVKPGAAPKQRWGGLRPYVGGGFGILSYKETGGFASGDDDTDDSFTSVHALGGVQIPLWKWIGAGAEVHYRWVKDALGAAGISEAFGEDDLGGPSFRIKITIGM